jgi:hypothetical protein
MEPDVEYHKGIVGGAVQAQSMTMVIEGKAVFTHREVDGGTLLRVQYVKM